MAPNIEFAQTDIIDGSQYGAFRGGDVYAGDMYSTIYTNSSETGSAKTLASFHAFNILDTNDPNTTTPMGYMGAFVSEAADFTISGNGLEFGINMGTSDNDVLLTLDATAMTLTTGVDDKSTTLTNSTAYTNTVDTLTISSNVDVTGGNIFLQSNPFVTSGSNSWSLYHPDDTDGSNSFTRKMVEASTDTLTLNADSIVFNDSDGSNTGGVTISNSLTVDGDLTVSGTTVTMNVSDINVEDRSILMASTVLETDSPTWQTLQNAGIKVGKTGTNDDIETNTDEGWIRFILDSGGVATTASVDITARDTVRWNSNIPISVMSDEALSYDTSVLRETDLTLETTDSYDTTKTELTSTTFTITKIDDDAGGLVSSDTNMQDASQIVLTDIFSEYRNTTIAESITLENTATGGGSTLLEIAGLTLTNNTDSPTSTYTLSTTEGVFEDTSGNRKNTISNTSVTLEDTDDGDAYTSYNSYLQLDEARFTRDNEFAYYGRDGLQISDTDTNVVTINKTSISITDGTDEYTITASGASSETMKIMDSSGDNPDSYFLLRFNDTEGVLYFDYYNGVDTTSTKFTIGTS